MFLKCLEFLMLFLFFHGYKCSVDPNTMIEYTRVISKIDPKRLGQFYPGTLWCGPGNLTENFDQLGMEIESDKCCRTHDCCLDYIDPGETKNDLTNDGEIRRYSCECDDKLRECFHAVGNPMADFLGGEYFDKSAIQCFRKDYPVVECTRRVWTSSFKNSKCAEYSYDTSGQKINQWFDVPSYSDN